MEKTYKEITINIDTSALEESINKATEIVKKANKWFVSGYEL